MLTEETIKATTGLEGLTPEQVTTITNLSKTDEQSVISAKYREMHDEIDAKVKEVTGIDKGSMKTTEYLAKALTDTIAYKDKFTAMETENNTLKEQIKAGSADKELLAQKDATIADLTKKFNEKNEELKNAKAGFESERLNMRIEADINSAMASIKFKEDISDTALSVLKKQAIAEVKGKRPGYVPDGKGGETLVFHDENGVELRNPDNQLNFFTTTELLRGSFKAMGILGDSTPGGGGAGGKGGGVSNKTFAGATTKAEAYDIAESIALSEGLTRGSVDFGNRVSKIIVDNADVWNKLK